MTSQLSASGTRFRCFSILFLLFNRNFQKRFARRSPETRASFFVTGSIRVQLCGDAAAPAPRPWLLGDFKSHKGILPSGSKTNVKNESWNIMDLGLSENYWLHLQIMAMVMGRIRINHRNRRYPFQTTQLSIRRYQTAKKWPNSTKQREQPGYRGFSAIHWVEFYRGKGSPLQRMNNSLCKTVHMMNISSESNPQLFSKRVKDP